MPFLVRETVNRHSTVRKIFNMNVAQPVTGTKKSLLKAFLREFAPSNEPRPDSNFEKYYIKN